MRPTASLDVSLLPATSGDGDFGFGEIDTDRS